jgi:hypothetical protein
MKNLKPSSERSSKSAEKAKNHEFNLYEGETQTPQIFK